MDQLEVLAKPKAMEHALTDLATDDDILSRAESRQRRAIEEWNQTTEVPTGLIIDEDFNLESWGSLDCKNGVFRPACLIESVFQCLYITKDNVHELYSSVPKRYSAKKLARDADTALETNNVLLSEHVLSRMEEIWTNNARPQSAKDFPKDNLFATIRYHATISRNWELKRYISCLVFDEDSLKLFRQFSGRKTIHSALKNARRLTEKNAEDLLNDLQSRSIQYNLAASLSTMRQNLRTVAGTSSSNPRPTFEFINTTHGDNLSPVEDHVICKVYDWRKTGPGEPTESYLRFSRRQSAITKSSEERTVSSYFPDSVSPKNEDFVLVALHTSERHNNYNYHLCLYNVTGKREPPSKSDLALALQETCVNDVFYLASPYNHDVKNVYRNLRMAKFEGAQKIWNSARAWRHEMQQFLPTVDHSKVPGHATESNGKKAKLFAPVGKEVIVID
jgi:hypothetical protein